MKKSILCALVISVFMIIPTAYAGKMELTTYYPAPYGEYKNLNSTEGANFATTSGNVGIGMTNPGAKLEVKAGAEGQGSPVTAIKIWGPNTPENSNSAQDIQWGFSVSGSSRIRAYRGNSWDTYLQFLTNPVTPADDNPQVRMHISENGNVGIGTTLPNAKLEVRSDGDDMVEVLRLSTKSTTWTSGYGPRLTFYNGADLRPMAAINGALQTSNNGNYGYLGFYTRTSDALGLQEKMRVLANGNVGIGKTGPGEKLDVDGTVKATGYKSSDGSAGLTQALYVSRPSCHITVKNGLITGQQGCEELIL